MDRALVLTKDEMNTIVEWADIAETTTGLTRKEQLLRDLLRRK